MEEAFDNDGPYRLFGHAEARSRPPDVSVAFSAMAPVWLLRLGALALALLTACFLESATPIVFPALRGGLTSTEASSLGPKERGTGQGSNAAVSGGAPLRLETELLDAEFHKACDDVRHFASQPNDHELLELYALYQQATIGDYSSKLPSPWFDYMEAQRLAAWRRLRGMDSIEAKRRYIDLVVKLRSKYGTNLRDHSGSARSNSESDNAST